MNPSFQICEVCELLDKDRSQKICYFCSLCKVWMCLPCLNNPVRRIQAVIRRRIHAKR